MASVNSVQHVMRIAISQSRPMAGISISVVPGNPHISLRVKRAGFMGIMQNATKKLLMAI
jgi:hypothetical protein